MKPRIHKTADWGWTFSYPGAPTVPMAKVVHQPCPTWRDAIKACDVWHAQQELFEAVAATRKERT